MKFLYAAIALSALQAYTCAAAANGTGSTITCESCPTTTTAVGQFVTRTSAPKMSCSGPSLTVIPNAGGSGVPPNGSGSSASGSGAAPGSAAPTGGNSAQPPAPAFTGAGNRIGGSLGGTVAVALAAAYVL